MAIGSITKKDVTTAVTSVGYLARLDLKGEGEYILFSEVARRLGSDFAARLKALSGSPNSDRVAISVLAEMVNRGKLALEEADRSLTIRGEAWMTNAKRLLALGGKREDYDADELRAAHREQPASMSLIELLSRESTYVSEASSGLNSANFKAKGRTVGMSDFWLWTDDAPTVTARFRNFRNGQRMVEVSGELDASNTLSQEPFTVRLVRGTQVAVVSIGAETKLFDLGTTPFPRDSSAIEHPANLEITYRVPWFTSQDEFLDLVSRQLGLECRLVSVGARNEDGATLKINVFGERERVELFSQVFKLPYLGLSDDEDARTVGALREGLADLETSKLPNGGDLAAFVKEYGAEEGKKNTARLKAFHDGRVAKALAEERAELRRERKYGDGRNFGENALAYGIDLLFPF
jgi:hypothetical protein